MGIRKKHAKGRLDKYYHMAKEQGYRARSAFKLIQLNKKFDFLERAKVLIDLCAAPGGWLQVAAKYMPRSSIIVGVDLAPIKPIPGVTTHVEDITSAKCRSFLRGELKTWKADVVLHDGAPNVGTSWIQDAFAQSELTLSALKLATEFLMPGGVFVSKVFRSKDYNKLLWVFQELFDHVDATKPASSRNVSAEIFVVCRGFKAPKKIDPKFLDPKHVFREVDDGVVEEDEKKKRERNSAVLNDLLHPEKKRRHREGYPDGATTLHVTVPAAEFIRDHEYATLLARSNGITFNDDEESKKIGALDATTDNIRILCADLRVLGRREFRELIRWRAAARIALGLEKSREEREREKTQAEEAKAAAEAEARDAAESTPEGRAAAAAAAAAELEKERKRERRRARERKARELLRLRLGMEAPMDIGMEVEEGGIDDEADEEIAVSGLFNIGSAVQAKGLSVANGKPTNDPRPVSDDSDEGDEDEDEMDLDEDGASLMDSDDEIAQKMGDREEEMDYLYEQYQERVLKRNPKAFIKNERSKGKSKFEEWYGVEWEKKLGNEGGAVGAANETGSELGDSGDDSDSDSSWGDESDSDETPAVAGRKRKMDGDGGAVAPTAALSKRARVFFDNPLFRSAFVADGSDSGSKKSRFAKDATAASDSESDSDFYSRDKKASRKSRGADVSAKSKSGWTGGDSDSGDERAGKGGFEVVKDHSGGGEAAPVTSDFLIDTAQKYTLAQKLVTKSGRRDLLDDGFHRYAHNDPDGLPSWFLDDEAKHRARPQPVTKEAIEVMRARQRALDARPIKKVAEAKFRKRARAQAKVQRALRRANAIADDEDAAAAPEAARLRDAAKVMAKAAARKQEKKVHLVVAKNGNRAIKGRPQGVKGRYKMVDGVMKKEARAQKRAEAASKKKRRR